MVTKGIELLPLKNGVLNLATNQLRPYNDDDYFIFHLPVEYDPRVACPAWQKFISEATGTKKSQSRRRAV